MTLEKAIRLLAGSMILISVVLTLTLSPWWCQRRLKLTPERRAGSTERGQFSAAVDRWLLLTTFVG